MRANQVPGSLATIAALTLAAFMPGRALAHCDGMDGPVVQAARQALVTGDVNLALIWVQRGDEAEIRKVFARAMAIRGLNREAKELADSYFFETLVRLHRAGEGAPFTGLKPPGRDLGPAIPSGDRAIETGSLESVLKLLTDEVRRGASGHFNELMARKKFRRDDVAAGREYVKAYVEFIHYVERVHQAGMQAAHGHAGEGEEGGPHKHWCRIPEVT